MESEISNHDAFDNKEHEMIAFTRRRKLKLKRRILEARFSVCGPSIASNIKATRCLGFYLDLRLQFMSHKNFTLERVRRSEDRV